MEPLRRRAPPEGEVKGEVDDAEDGTPREESAIQRDLVRYVDDCTENFGHDSELLTGHDSELLSTRHDSGLLSKQIMWRTSKGGALMNFEGCSAAVLSTVAVLRRVRRTRRVQHDRAQPRAHRRRADRQHLRVWCGVSFPAVESYPMIDIFSLTIM